MTVVERPYRGSIQVDIAMAGIPSTSFDVSPQGNRHLPIVPSIVRPCVPVNKTQSRPASGHDPRLGAGGNGVAASRWLPRRRTLA